LIIAIDGGFNTLLLGVEIVLVGKPILISVNDECSCPGVIQIVQGLLVGLSGLLASLGGGLLAGTFGPQLYSAPELSRLIFQASSLACNRMHMHVIRRR
jgi:F0F1-type ATP synthase membrane subunit c/vacuolar-type H+-ATPase subunit K